MKKLVHIVMKQLLDSRETRFEVVILWKNFDWEFVMMSPRIWRSF